MQRGLRDQPERKRERPRESGIAKVRKRVRGLRDQLEKERLKDQRVRERVRERP